VWSAFSPAIAIFPLISGPGVPGLSLRIGQIGGKVFSSFLILASFGEAVVSAYFNMLFEELLLSLGALALPREAPGVVRE